MATVAEQFADILVLAGVNPVEVRAARGSAPPPCFAWTPPPRCGGGGNLWFLPRNAGEVASAASRRGTADSRSELDWMTP